MVSTGGTTRYVGLVVGDTGVGMVVWVAGVPGSEGVTRVVMVAVGGTGVGRAAVAVGDGVPGTGTEGGTSVVTTIAGGTGMTMLTGGGDRNVDVMVGEVVGPVVVIVEVPCAGAGVAGMVMPVPFPVTVGPVP